jgi:hypothetical protein
MIRIDSVKLKLPIHSICGYSDHLEHTQKLVGGVVIKDSHSSSPKMSQLGFKKVTITQNSKNESENGCVIELSSKILKQDYFNMITQNSLEQLVEQINYSQLIRFDKNQFIDYASILSCDITKNIQVENNASLLNYLSSVATLPIGDKHNVYRYKSIGNKGVTWNGKQTSFKERMAFYSKELEVKKDKKLLNYLTSKQVKQFDNVLRNEINLTQFATIRKYTNSNSLLLQDVLSSTENPNLLLFDKITKRINFDVDLKLFTEWQGMSLYQIEKLEGSKNIVKQFNGDMVRIRTFLESKVKGKISAYIKYYTNVANGLQLQNVQHENSAKAIRTLIKNCA